MNNLNFEEFEVAEEYGGARDFFEGVAVGVGIVAGIAGIVALT